MIRAIAVLACFLLLTSCMNAGNRFDVDKVSALSPAKSTISDATELLGKPTSRSALPNGGSLIEWSYSTGSPLGGSAGQASIIFDDKERMVRIDHLSSVD
jgi:hypothetical protein